MWYKFILKRNKYINGDIEILIQIKKEEEKYRKINTRRYLHEIFNDQIVIERKRSLNEISNNLTHNRQQFENELIRSNNAKLILMVENQQGYQNIIKHNYRTDYKPKSFIGTLHSFKHRYDMEVMFIDPDYNGQFLRYEFYYYLREYLK